MAGTFVLLVSLAMAFPDPVSPELHPPVAAGGLTVL
jgi:hypothetical protein